MDKTVKQDQEKKDLNASVLVAIAGTILCSGVIIGILFSSVPVFWALPLGLLYLLLHPFIGKVWTEIAISLANGIDKVYDFGIKWGGWQKGSKIMFAAWWPFLGPPYVLAAMIILLYGKLFKGLFTI